MFLPQTSAWYWLFLLKQNKSYIIIFIVAEHVRWRHLELSWSRAPRPWSQNDIYTIAPKYYRSDKNKSAKITIWPKKWRLARLSWFYFLKNIIFLIIYLLFIHYAHSVCTYISLNYLNVPYLHWPCINAPKRERMKKANFDQHTANSTC